MDPEVIQADWTWTGERFERGIQVAVADDGRIEAVGALRRRPTRALPGLALLPGFVNAHSHAFQRGLRGRGERFPAGQGSFWTWREAMYALVDSLTFEGLCDLYVQTFREMRDAGYTTVGEFHYVHHSPGTLDYACDEIVLRGAAAAGIRIALLNTYYATGGIGRPLEGAQRRFESRDPGAYWAQMDRLEALRDPRTQTLGAVAHSIRAVPADTVAELHREARRRGLVFHMHVEEQVKEIEECEAAYGRRPMSVFTEVLALEGGFTAVHCTHTDPDDMRRFLQSGGTVCVCPLTEGNLGDGLPDLTAVHAAGGRLSLGTDSNARISMLEDMRWLEYGQRLRHQARGLLADAEGQVARTLLHAATAGGARALGVDTGCMAPGRWADFVGVDLGHPALAGVGGEELLDALVFGADNAGIAGTFVGGRWRATGAER
ncbi:MAG: formimidoylglutamate deiminase [Gemmatimonadota bacterium]